MKQRALHLQADMGSRAARRRRLSPRAAEQEWVVRDRHIVHVDPAADCPCCRANEARILWLLSNARLVVYALCAWLGMSAALVLFRLL